MTRADWLAFCGQALLQTDAAQLAASAPEPETEQQQELLAALAAAEPLDLEKEYVRLFLSPLGAECALWQSVYTAEDRLAGEPHSSALRWYRGAGFEPALRNQPADHAGLLLLFHARQLASGARQEECASFAGEHLAWMPQFLDKLAGAARHPFYSLLAGVTRALLP